MHHHSTIEQRRDTQDRSLGNGSVVLESNSLGCICVFFQTKRDPAHRIVKIQDSSCQPECDRITEESRFNSFSPHCEKQQSLGRYMKTETHRNQNSPAPPHGEMQPSPCRHTKLAHWPSGCKRFPPRLHDSDLKHRKGHEELSVLRRACTRMVLSSVGIVTCMHLYFMILGRFF